MRASRWTPILLGALAAAPALAGPDLPLHRWSRVPLELPRAATEAGARCRSLAAADVDGDGVADLVATCDGTGTGRVVWRGNLGSIFPGDSLPLPPPFGPPEPLAATAILRPAPRMGGVTPETTARALARLEADGEVSGPPEAALGMRLNSDALPDLVVIEPGAAAPTVYLTAALATFTVDTTADTVDASPGDGLCRDAAGKCSLRAAIAEANLTAGADSIVFDVGTGIPAILVTGSALPVIVLPITIDGATGGASRVDVKRNGTFGGDGLRLSSGASGSSIRGLLVEGFGGAGLQINTSSNVVENCWLGPDAAGSSGGPGNGVGGVALGASAADNTIGGSTAAQRNVIAHNGGYQVHLQSSGNAVQGNYIGTDVTGLLDITGQADGIALDGISGTTTIGGSTATPGAPPGNLISGNSYGVRARTGSGLVIEGNLIGPGADGVSLVGNSIGIGFENGANHDTVGGADPSLRNVVSASQNEGIEIGVGPTSSVVSSITVQGNWLGTDRSGTQCLGNSGDGVYIQDNAQNNLIGGIAPAPGVPPGNLIACNQFNGVRITGTTSTGNVVQGNLIGSDPGHPALSGNAFQGVDLVDDPLSVPPTDGPSSTTVGGTPSAPGACDGGCNRIAGNGAAGIRVERDASLKNTFVGNAIVGNAGLGIDLGIEGVTPNDPGDADAGANGLLNDPVITGTQFDGTQTQVDGTLNSSANASFTLDFYANPGSHDPSGHGEGEAWIGSRTVTTDASGNASFTFTVGGNRPYVAATTRDASGNTSEFSGVFFNPGEAARADLLASRGAGSVVSVTYTPACSAIDHTVYMGTSGPGAMTGIAWTASFCGLGITGSASFDPGTPSPGTLLYFVVVGRSASREGSYGAGSAGERAEAVGVGACDLPQAKTSSCP